MPESYKSEVLSLSKNRRTSTGAGLELLPLQADKMPTKDRSLWRDTDGLNACLSSRFLPPRAALLPGAQGTADSRCAVGDIKTCAHLLSLPQPRDPQ